MVARKRLRRKAKYAPPSLALASSVQPVPIVFDVGDEAAAPLSVTQAGDHGEPVPSSVFPDSLPTRAKPAAATDQSRAAARYRGER